MRPPRRSCGSATMADARSPCRHWSAAARGRLAQWSHPVEAHYFRATVTAKVTANPPDNSRPFLADLRSAPPAVAISACPCSGSVTGFAVTPATARCMSAPSGSWPRGLGRRCSSTATPRPRSSVRSWPAPRVPARRRKRRVLPSRRGCPGDRAAAVPLAGGHPVVAPAAPTPRSRRSDPPILERRQV
jgi:hypothetical protein